MGSFDIVLLTRDCPGCRGRARAVCGHCLATLAHTTPTGETLAARAAVIDVERLVALWSYGPVSRSVVLALKNRSRADLAPVLATALAERVVEQVAATPEVVAWVPASARGRRRRGYDQGRLLARSVAERLGVPSRRLLVRVDPGGGGRRSRHQRLHGPRLSTGPNPRRSGVARSEMAGRRILIVDDVLTTGGSLARGVALLRCGGAAGVDAAVLAVVDPTAATSRVAGAR